MNFDTGNPIPSKDPRDLDDNAGILDLLLQSEESSVPDRLGRPRKTWASVEAAADALMSPNVEALAQLDPADLGLLRLFAPGELDTVAASSLGLILLALDNPASGRTALGLGNAAVLSTGPNGVATLDGSGKLAAAQRPDPVDPVTQARDARAAWTVYTPVLTTRSGALTSGAATGSYAVIFGICHWRARVTITSRGTASYIRLTLPAAAKAGSTSLPIPARESAVNYRLGAAVIDDALTMAELVSFDGNDLVTADGCVIFVNGSYPIT